MPAHPDIQFRPLRHDEWQVFQALRLLSITDMPEAIYPTYEEESNRTLEQVKAELLKQSTRLSTMPIRMTN